MKVSVLNLDNKQVGDIFLSPDIYQCPVRDDILHKVIEWQRAKKRSGTRKTKGISEISGTTRKPHAQKGTGRARQGSLRSPQMRGGAVIFGPVVRDHGYSMQKKVRALGLKMALSSKVLEQKLLILDGLSLSSGKTKDLDVQLKGMGIKSGLFIGIEKERDSNFYKAYKNLIRMDALPSDALNVYDILNHEHLILTKDSVEFINARFSVQDEQQVALEEKVAPKKSVAKKSKKEIEGDL